MLSHKGARVDIQTEDGSTSMHWLVNIRNREMRVACLKKLLEKQPDLNLIATLETVFERAARNNDIPSYDTLGYFYTCEDHSTRPSVDMPVIQRILKGEDVDINALLTEQHRLALLKRTILTPFHYTLLLKKTGIAEVLIHDGIDVNIHDATGRSLLQYAVYFRDIEILNLLLLWMQAVIYKRDTMLTYFQFDNVEAVSILLQFNT